MGKVCIYFISIGVYNFPNGDKFEGVWNLDKIDGKGKQFAVIYQEYTIIRMGISLKEYGKMD